MEPRARIGSQIGDDFEVEMRQLCSISPICSAQLSNYVLNISRVKAVARRYSRFKVSYSHHAKPYSIRSPYEYVHAILLENEVWEMKTTIYCQIM